MYLHLYKEKKLIQILVVEDEKFLEENSEFLKSEFGFDEYILNENQIANIEINISEEEKE